MKNDPAVATPLEKPRILIQLDPDVHASVFDRVVAVDAGVDHLFTYSRVQPKDVESLVHGAIFTRGVDDLHRTAIFIGGSNVTGGEALLDQVTKTFFGPMRVSVMLDANGANTTAAAAVLFAGQHVNLTEAQALVLGGTGPVGQRAARLLARQGAKVKLASRALDRATSAANAVNQAVTGQRVSPVAIDNDAVLAQALQGVSIVIAAGAAGVVLLPQHVRQQAKDLKVVVDLNAVPPAGVENVKAADKAKERDGQIVYGAIGVGGLKMKIHKKAIRTLFETNDHILDAETIYDLAPPPPGSPA